MTLDPPSLPQGAIRVIWPEPGSAGYDGPCPNCGASGLKRRLADVAWTAPKLPKGDRKPVFACPACDARFYPPLRVPNYHDPDVMDWGWHQFHIQQGAGLVPITDTLGLIARPPGTRFLEIGCGYGFGLDFAIHALGWRGIGIDPSPMARLGAADLGVTIRDGYFPDADPEAAQWDVIAATEVIEHVTKPSDLLAALRARLAPDGILLLTTPDGAAIDPATPDAALVQLLAPGIHMVFQTETSLRRLLADSGFADARIYRDGLTLIAYAGAIGGALIDDPRAQRQRFRGYLAGRAGQVPAGSDLGLGFAGRAMFEACVDLDWAAARAARDVLWPAIRARFGLDLDGMTQLPPALTALGLAALKDAMPLNLGMILYAEASRLRADPARRAEAGPRFALASEAARALHSALAGVSLNDGLAEELIWRGAAEAAIEAARTGAPDALDRFDVLRRHGVAGAERLRIVWRGVIELTNADAPDAARALMAAERLDRPDAALPDDLRRDIHIVLGQLALADGGDPAQAIAMAEALGAADPVTSEFLLGGFIRLVNAARYDEAIAVIDTQNIVSRAVARDDATGRDARLALAMLDLATGDAVDVPARLAGLEIDTAQRRAILIGAFSRLVNAARYADAERFAQAQAIEALIGAGGDEPARDAIIGLAILDLVLGDPAMAAARIADADIDAGRRRQITLGAFVTLVNRSRYDEALALRDTAPIEAWAAAPRDADGADASIALIALALVSGDPVAVPALVERLPNLTDQARADACAQAALRLIHLGRLDEARALADAIDPAALDPASRIELLAIQARFAIADSRTDALAACLDALEAAGADPARVKSLAVSGFVTLVNRGDFAGAALLRPRIEPDFANYPKAATDEARGAGFALGVLDLQEPAQPHRAEAAFAAVRRGFAASLAEGETAPALFWEALRGEVIALHRTARAAEARALGRAMLARYAGAPEDLARDLTQADS